MKLSLPTMHKVLSERRLQIVIRFSKTTAAGGWREHMRGSVQAHVKLCDKHTHQSLSTPRALAVSSNPIETCHHTTDSPQVAMVPRP